MPSMSNFRLIESKPPSPPPRKMNWLRSTLTAVLSFGILALIGYLLWLEWPTILMTSIRWQKQIVNQMSELLYLTHQSAGSMWNLAQISFLYGIFHALGPGHGKVVVSTYLATHNTKIKIGIYITLISALVQALTAIALVTAVLFVIEASMRQLNGVVNQFFHASYVGVFLLGLYIVWQGIAQWRKSRTSAHQHDHSYHHTHDSNCGCGHKHLASADELNQASSVKEYAAMIFSIGLRPCTGAILVLFFANLADVYWLGILSSFVMAVGTAITTSSIALMTVSGRKFVRYYLKDSAYKTINIWPFLRMFSGLFLMLVTIILFNQGGFGMSPMFNGSH